MKILLPTLTVAAMSFVAAANEAHAQSRVTGHAQQAEQNGCAKIGDPSKRLECYDTLEKTPEEKFGSVSGRISTFSITRNSAVLPTEIYLIPLPLSESRKVSLRKGSLVAMYPLIDGMKKGRSAPNGDFRISHVAEGRYLVVVISDAFSMQASGEGCERLSEGILKPESGPGYVTRCATTEVYGGEEASIFMTLRGRR